MTKLIEEKKLIVESAYSAEGIIATLDALIVEREQFEQNEYARSNKRLYGLLGKVLELYTTAAESETLLTETIKQMKERMKVRGIRVQTNTVALTLFVRYLFNTDRQRALNYSRTLQAAVQQGISVKGLSRFIEDNGGVEECKKKFTKSADVLQREAQVASRLPDVDECLGTAVSQPLATFKVLPKLVENVYDKDFFFVIAKADKQGNVKALATVPTYSAGIANWAKKQLARDLVARQEESSKALKEKRKESALEAAKPNVFENTPTDDVGELIAA
jgi:hypothetical protein